MKRILPFFVAFGLLVLGLAGLTQFSTAQTVPNTSLVTTIPLCKSVTSTMACPTINAPNSPKTYQMNGTVSSGAGAATINVECTSNGSNWDLLGSGSLVLGTATTSLSFVSADRCAQVRGNVTAISGTGASVNVNMGY